MNYPISFIIDKTADDILSYATRIMSEREIQNDMAEYVIDKVMMEIRRRKVCDLVNASISYINQLEERQKDEPGEQPHT